MSFEISCHLRFRVIMNLSQISIEWIRTPKPISGRDGWMVISVWRSDKSTYGANKADQKSQFHVLGIRAVPSNYKNTLFLDAQASLRPTLVTDYVDELRLLR